MPSNFVGEAILELLLTSERQAGLPPMYCMVERGWIWLCSAINTLTLHVTQNNFACMHMFFTQASKLPTSTCRLKAEESDVPLFLTVIKIQSTVTAGGQRTVKISPLIAFEFCPALSMIYYVHFLAERF